MKTYFLTRKKEFVECEVVKTTNHKRTIKILEGVLKGKQRTVHPEGVAWGKLYPRVFHSEEKPKDFFVFKGRVILKKTEKNPLVPNFDNHFIFQKILSHIVDCVNAKENLLLTGGMGVGKTTHIEQLAQRINQPVLRVNLNGETRMSDFIGKCSIVDGQKGPITVWTDGILPRAMREGLWLILDEVDFADPAILSLLHPVLEENSVLVLKENNGEVIRPHHNFRIFGTANSVGSMQDKAGSYAGTNQMNEAFLDRWHVLEMPNLDPKSELKVLKTKVLGIKNRWAKKIIEFANTVRDGKTELGESFSAGFSTRRCIQWAKKTALLRSPILGAEMTFFSKISPSEKDVVVKALETLFGGGAKRQKRLKMVEPQGVSDAPPVKKKRGRPAKNKNVEQIVNAA